MINQFLKQTEGKTLKFRRDLSSPRNMLKTLVAFANAKGGRLVFDEQPMPALDKKTLQTLKRVRPEQGRLVPTQGAVLRFGKARDQHFLDAWVQCGRFRGLGKSGVSCIRNSLITRVFRELGVVEQWGSEIRRIFDEAARQGLAELVIEEIATGVRLRSRLARHHAAGQPRSHDPQALQIASSRLESRLDAKVVFFLAEQTSGKAALAMQLGHATVSGELHKQMRRLLGQGLIETTVPDKPQSRLQKYQLTGQGRQVLQEE